LYHAASAKPADYLSMGRRAGGHDDPTRRGDRRDDLYGAGLRVSWASRSRPPMML